MTPLDAALAYASWGWHVLPVVPGGKVPATAHGIKDATTDEATIRSWWVRTENLNVGVACGRVSDLIVFDIDPRNGGEDGWESWIEKVGGELDGATQLTAGGGTHHLCSYAEGVKSCKLTEGVDLLSDGRYFVAYPSAVEGRNYSWELSSDPFDGVAPSTIPVAWLEAMAARKPDGVADGAIIRGNRNDGLTSLAGCMRQHGMTEAEILAAIGVANETRCEVPLPSSEVRQIAKSVARYEPEHDAAADAAIGNSAADRLLEGLASSSAEYFFTRGTSFLAQPSPLPWLIKGWLPQYGMAMVFGESGVGKTFIALDMACSVACGLPWCGRQVKQAPVAYLCGEGNFGMRSRVASWCRARGVDSLDGLLISNKPISLDEPRAAEQVLGALSPMAGDPPALTVIDTIHAHMVGDESTARDTRVMLNACGVIAAATGGVVLLIHHVGHANEAKARARGSSAWRGALDAQIYVHAGKNDGIIVDCVKLKDAQEPESICGTLESVDLGWVDEDGEPCPGAAFVRLTGDEAAEVKKRSRGDKELQGRRLIEDAWWASGTEMRDGAPYVSRDALLQYMVQGQGVAESTARKRLQPSGALLRQLVESRYLSPLPSAMGYGWVVVDSTTVSALTLALRSR